MNALSQIARVRQERHTEPFLAPLIVHLEGELVLSDLYWERVVALLKTKPRLVFAFLLSCLGGSKGSGAFLEKHLTLEPGDLCFDQDQLQKVRAATADPVVKLTVVSQLPETLAHSLMDYLRLPRGCLSLVAPVESVAQGLPPIRSKNNTLLQSFSSLVQAMRLRHWPKNLLVLLPLIAAHRFADSQAWSKAVLAAFAFALVSSAVYLLNDVLDVVNDRAHPVKKKRPFAACELPLRSRFLLSPLLVTAAATLSLQLPSAFFLVLSAYFLTNVCYSLGFKRFHSLDLVLLAAMYTARVVAGGQATEIVVSPWLFAFAVFFFFGLAAAKRYSDMLLSPVTEQLGRGYRNEDKPAVMSLGVASSLLACLVLALYINSPSISVLYGQPQVLWVFLPVLVFWISRIWISAARGDIHSDPLIFVMGDRQSHIAAAAALAVFWFAL